MNFGRVLGKNKVEKWFTIMFTSFLILMFTMEHINGRFWLNDFKVLYTAAEAFVNGKPVYGVSFGLDTGFYKYSPFDLLFYVPYTYLPYDWAASIHFVISGIVFLLLVRMVDKLFGFSLSQKEQGWLLLILFVAVVVHLTRELHLGNVNILLVAVVCWAFLQWKRQKWIVGAILVAIAILTKPYLAILALPFLFGGHWREIGYTLFALIILISGSFILFGIETAKQLYVQWIYAMLDHSGYLTSANTIFSMQKHLTGFTMPVAVKLMIFILFSIGLIGLLYWKKGEKTQNTHEGNSWLYFSAFLLFALVPNFLITDTEHFLFSLPVIWWILSRFSQLAFGEKTVLIIGLILYAFNPVSDWGTLGMGNLMIVFTAIFHFMKFNPNNNIPETVLP